MSIDDQLADVMIALVATLSLVFVIAFAYRKVTGGSLRPSGPVQIKSVTALGAREKLVLVTLGQEELLLGVTSAQITRLHCRRSFERAMDEAQA